MKRSKFNLSNYKLLTMDQGKLVPIGLTEVLPGDTIQQATSALVRVSPLVAPVMHPVNVRIHHWFVPFREIWEDFEKFITGGPDGNDASVFPTITVNPSVGDLADYLGVPTGTSMAVSALPFRAYAMIFNEMYRDQDLTTAVALDIASGADSTTSTALQSAAWEKDYFTTCRPWTQKGDDVTLPLGTSADVTITGNNAEFQWKTTSEGTNRNVQHYNTSPYPLRLNGLTGGVTSNVKWGTETGLTGSADLSSATSATINQLREAMALQRYAEARAKYGSRYVEYLRYLGIRPADGRVTGPEYLGGGRQTIQFSEVLQTGVDSTDGGLGTMGGHGIGAMRSNRYRKFFEEHGYIVSVMSVLPKTIYAQGLPRHWNRRTRFDFFQRELQHIGQQEVLNKEIYTAAASPDDVFGYQDRYDEYKRSESSIAGEFRSTLDHWHMARIFASEPALNSSFVVANPTDRIYASTSTHELYVMANHSIQARRMVAP